MPVQCAANSMYDFRLASVLLATVVVAVGAMIGGELSTVEKSLQFEAAFQGELFKRCDDGFNGEKKTTRTA
ncbi:unnamed protein product [Macrosiphum euphorbiae]|uniref:Uncharacterized protein n=1 Tax=Macrosiphum euphorbiae TaxID=13131 RepID=A0AAV0W7C6_9HEMI|nr:unnamed protein product [Macrosiphum euphorbiae]